MLVSAESIRASAPSRTALATSDASALVGRFRSTIDSSISVATITGLACRRHRPMACFCTSGTRSRAVSTPRSPRATMMPSNASITASSRSRASGRSSLAMTGTRMPSASITDRTAAASAGDRTKERATRSTPSRRAKRRSSMSLSVRGGALTATPGRFMPLWSRIVPPRVTTHSTSFRSRRPGPAVPPSRRPGGSCRRGGRHRPGRRRSSTAGPGFRSLQ